MLKVGQKMSFWEDSDVLKPIFLELWCTALPVKHPVSGLWQILKNLKSKIVSLQRQQLNCSILISNGFLTHWARCQPQRLGNEHEQSDMSVNGIFQLLQ